MFILPGVFLLVVSGPYKAESADHLPQMPNTLVHIYKSLLQKDQILLPTFLYPLTHYFKNCHHLVIFTF